MRRSRWLCAVALLFASLGVTESGAALEAPTRAAAARLGSPKEVAALAARARGASDPLIAIDALSALGGHAASDALCALLREGLPDATSDRILEKLAERPRPGALDTLELLARHRRPRRAVLALRAIAALGVADAKLDASTTKLLAAGLRDSDPSVRGTAAAALARRFERLDQTGSSTARAAQVNELVADVLVRAVARGVPEAASAAGWASPEATLLRLHTALTGQPLAATLDAYGAALARKTLSDAAKLDLLARLGEIATPATKAFLAGLIAERRFAADSALQRALIETEKRIVQKPAASGGTR